MWIGLVGGVSAAVALWLAIDGGSAGARASGAVSVVGPEKPSPVERFALAELNVAIAGLRDARGDPKCALHIVVGTRTSNREVKRLLDHKFAGPERRAEGYALKLSRDTVLIAGSDPNGVLYGVMDFIHYHLPQIWSGEAMAVDLHEAPRIDLRGLWTWGGRIYNYRMFFDQMARWKMNLAILWHDHVPRDAAAIQQYAADRGIRIVWGYSWGWPDIIKWGAAETIAAAEKKVVEDFETQYAELTPYGIYFQSATEGGAARGQGDKLVGFACRAAAPLLAKCPDLWISCGLHYTSFADNPDVLRGIDPRLNIMIEDIASFPFTYSAQEVRPEALAATKKLVSLRGEKEDIGYVLKGFHANCGGGDPQLITDMAALQKLAAERPLDPGNEVGWRRNLPIALSVLDEMVDSPARRRSVTLLMEDGLWEIRPWYPVALASEAMWNPCREPGELIRALDISGATLSAINSVEPSSALPLW
jgi:hypothetical protein